MSSMTVFAAPRGRDRDRMIGMATFASARPAMLEPAFRDLRGILATGVVRVGGRHALRIEFDPGAVSYEQLLERFWVLDEQTAALGAHTESAVLVHSAEQEAAASAARDRHSLVLGRPLAAAVLRVGREVGTPGATSPASQAASSSSRSASQSACQALSSSYACGPETTSAARAAARATTSGSS